MNTKFVAVKIRAEITIHMPHTTGIYYTLCGLDGDDPNPSIEQSIIDVPNDAVIDCLDCFLLWNVSRKYTLKDFGTPNPD